ncbi:hypothetical protein PRIPAC_76276 [Pristionchus pacificus]|uniref:Uncharacterized protein n=1 Tax=Pristionchus pacificus TaxID=54126 RepID=A0A2A6C676_PRIPA|nr:hypothetical protein PRIPAC_76276 [Pristionchus pacificus]|eukprot:PDM73588.1 hypothetical protein PRIPAC_40944 [Pristionchus pacificus]
MENEETDSSSRLTPNGRLLPVDQPSSIYAQNQQDDVNDERKEDGMSMKRGMGSGDAPSMLTYGGGMGMAPPMAPD